MRAKLWSLILLAILPCFWMALSTPAVGVYHDDSIYIITARALAQGHGYAIESVPGGMPQTKYPILFPAVLSIVWRLFPDFPSNTLFLKLVPFACCVLWLLSVAFLFRKIAPDLRWAAVAIVASSPMVVFFGTAVLSECMFSALAVVALWQMMNWERTLALQHMIFAAISAAAAFHTRSFGLALVVSGMLVFLRRSWRHGLGFAIIAGVCMLPWFYWQYVNKNAPSAYLSSSNYYTGYNLITNFNWYEKWTIIWKNALAIPVSVSLLYEIGWGWLAGFLFLPLLLRGWWKSLRFGSGRESLAMFAGISCTLILLWAWPPLRFLVPLLPLAILFIWQGTPDRLRSAVGVVALVIALYGQAASYRASLSSRESGLWISPAVEPHSWKAFQAQLEWISANTKPEDIIQSNLDPTIYLFTGRRAVRGSERNATLRFYLGRESPLGTAETFHADLRKARASYAVETPWPWFSESLPLESLYEALQQLRPAVLGLEHTVPGTKFRIYKVDE